MKTFKAFLLEYELTDPHKKGEATPSNTHEDDIDHDEFHKKELGKIGDYSVVHYKHKTRGSHFTFLRDSNGATIGAVEHKKPTKSGRLAISNITKLNHDSNGYPVKKHVMTDVLHHLIKHGHTLESDNTNTEHGAHPMLMRLSSGVKTHIEDGKGNVIPHEGDVTSPENQKKYTIRSTDPSFLDNNKHKHVLVFGGG